MKHFLLALAAGALFAGCAQTDPPKSQAQLIETYWKAVELEGKPVEVKAGTREPHMVLRSDKNAVNGFSGCNTFRGAYEMNGESLRFKNMASTLMACLPAGGDTEKNFLSAINATASQRISGETLELRDQDSKVRARFESRYMK
jgi:copper homeostasis protein (lipoprotein)